MSTLAVKSFDTTDDNGAPVSFTVDSQLLDYIEPARTFGAADLAETTAGRRYQPTVVAVPDHRPAAVAPMILSTGTDQKLRLVRRVASGQADLPANFEMIDLSEGFAHIATGTVRAFAAGWTADDKVTLAVAVDSTAPGNPSQILIAYDVKTRDNDWSKLPWVSYGTRDALKIDGMRVVREPDGGWLTLMSGGSGVLDNAYVIRQERPASFQTEGMVYSTPVDMTEIADYQVGCVASAAAMHVLGTNPRGRRILVTREVPPLDENGRPVSTPFMTFRCPDGSNVLAVGVDRPGTGADLYVGGKGVHRLAAADFEEQEEATFETVMPEAAANGVERVVVAEAADGATTVWALDGAGRLLMTSRPRHQPGQTTPVPWSEPIVLRRGVQEIAPVSGDRHLTASVLVIYDEGLAGSLVRDAQGIWQDEPITVADVGAATRLLTFQTVVALKDAKGNPAKGKVRLSASVASTLVFNGHSHFIYPGNDAVVDVPYDGKLTISNRALSFSPATYRIKVDGWSRAIDINPAFGLYQQFDELSADDLRNAKKADGQPLLGEEYRTGDQAGSLDALVQSLKKASEAITSKQGGTDGVWLVQDGADFSSRVAANALPDGYSWGLASDGKGDLKPMDAAAANELAGQAGRASAGGFWADFSLSDIFEWIANAPSKAVRFVVRKVADVVEFVCEIGGKIGRFIMNTLEEIGSFFKWLWNTVKTAVEDVWNFLKYLFNWDDIIAVRDKMRDMFENQLLNLKKEVQTLKPVVSSFFDQGIKKIQDMKRERGFPVSAPGAEDPIDQARREGSDAKDATVNSGPGSWILEQFSNISKSLITIELPPTAESEFDLMAVFQNQLNRMKTLSRDMAGAIETIFPDGNPSIADLTFDKLKDVVMAVGLTIAEGALQLGKDLCLALIDALAALIDAFHGVMFARVRLPLLEKLWELVSDEEKDLSFSVIDVVLLPPALLGTITFKLVFPKEDIKAVLNVSLPAEEVAAVQSSRLMTLAFFMKDMVGTFISFVAAVFEGLSSMVPIVKSKVGVWKWMVWVAGTIAHLQSVKKFFGVTKASTTVLVLEKVEWLLGLLQRIAKYLKNKVPEMSPLEYTAEIQRFALVDLMLYPLRAVMKTIAVIADEDGNYAVLEMVQYYGNILSRTLSAGAKLVEIPTKKAYLGGGAIVAALFIGVIPGLLYNIISYNEAEAA